MKYGTVRHVDRPISRTVIGSMAFNPERQAETFAALDRFVELGGNCIDLAHVYNGGGSHRVVGDYLRARGRDKLILFDKGCHPYGRSRVTREDMASDISENQERLGFDYTEFFVLHRDDEDVPVGEIVEWLNEHKQAGRIGAFGGSNWSEARIVEANEYAASKGLQGFSVSSPGLSLATANEVMWGGSVLVDAASYAWFKETQFPMFAWSSAANGFFAGRESDDIRRVYHSEVNFGRLERVKKMAAEKKVTPTQLAVAWVLNQPLNVFALVGPADAEQVSDNLVAVEIDLTPEELTFLEHGTL